MKLVFAAMVVATSLWVFLDARRLGVTKSGEVAHTGRIKADMGPLGWLVCCLFLWIVAFPLYLFKRPGFLRRHDSGQPLARGSGVDRGDDVRLLGTRASSGPPNALQSHEKTMRAEGPYRTWTVLGAYGIAAVICLMHAFKFVSSPYLPQVAGLITMVGLTASIWSRGSLDRTLGQIHADIKSGRQAPMTPLDKVIVLLGGALVVITTIQMTP